jgi:glycine/D-amino acid oxidase-like deaminating enzyme
MATPNAQAPHSHIVICGAGVIGAATAYYLAKRGVKCTLIERVSVAGAASGKAGGFLALDWSDGSPVGALARLSFELHAGLQEELGIDIDYRCGNGESKLRASMKVVASPAETIGSLRFANTMPPLSC